MQVTLPDLPRTGCCRGNSEQSACGHQAIEKYSGSHAAPVSAVVKGCADPGFQVGKRKSSPIDCAEDPEGFAAAAKAASQVHSTDHTHSLPLSRTRMCFYSALWCISAQIG